MKDTNGTVLTTSDDQKLRWKEHFEELLNRPAPEQTANITPKEEDLPISLEAPTMEEIKKAIRTLNNGKAAGPDGIPAEAMKAAQEVSMEVFHPLLEGCSKLKSQQTRQVQERLVSTLEHMQVQK